MPPLPPPPDLEAALIQFRSWGSVVEHFLFAAPPSITLATHEAAAKASLEAVIHEAGQPPSLWRSIPTRWTPDTIGRAVSVTPSQFLGSHFDWPARKPLFSFPGSFGLHPYDYEVDDRMRGQSSGGPVGEGYAHAVLDPPYGLYGLQMERHRSPLPLGKAFLRLCDALFGDLETLEIYEWPTDCSNYFDAGHDWWGSFFWTVSAPTKKWIVTILASTTD